MVPPQRRAQAKIEQVLEAVGLLLNVVASVAVARLRSKRSSTTSPAPTPKNISACSRDFKNALNAGQMRAAEPDASTPTGWRVNAWVKKGILLGFRMGGDRGYVGRLRRASRSSTRPLTR